MPFSACSNEHFASDEDHRAPEGVDARVIPYGGIGSSAHSVPTRPLWSAVAQRFAIDPSVGGGLAMAAVTSRRVATVILRRVLIVDDNMALAENLAEILEIAGHATQVASSAEEAFPKARDTEPDVLVTDFRLPGINGAAFVSRFLLAHPRVRAMVISAYTNDATIDAATDAGAAFMPKPLDFVGLSRWVGEAHA